MSTISARAPGVLRSIAVLGVVVAVVGTVVIWQFLDDLEQTTDSSLLIGEQVTVTLTDTIDVADQVLGAIDDGLLTVESTLDTLDDVLQSTAGVAAATSSLTATLPASFGAIDAALASVQQVAETIDSTLTALSNLPLAPDYDPDVTLGAAIDEVRQTVGSIGNDLATISAELQSFADGSVDLSAEIDSLAADVASTREALAGTDQLLDEYRSSANEVGQLAAATRGDLDSSMTWMRVVLLALGLLLVISQYVPWTLAAALRTDVTGDDNVKPVRQPEPGPDSSV